MFSASISVSTPFLSSKSTLHAPSPLPTSIRFRQPPRVSAAYAATAERTASTTSRISTTASLYEVLGIHTGATCHEIKTAYRRLARVLHPDAGKDTSADEFMRIHAAYSTLSDPEKRAEYDRNLFRRRRPVSKPFAMSTEFSGYAGRRWETDQCW